MALNYEFEWTERRVWLGDCTKGGGEEWAKKNVKPWRLFQNTNCDWQRICIRNKIEEVERRNRSLAAPNLMVLSLSDRPRDDGGREGWFPHPSPWCPVILPLWIISVGYHCKKVVLFPGSVLKRGLSLSKRSFSSQSETNVLASLSRQKCCKKSSLQFNKQFCCQWWPVRTASLEKSYRYRHLINTNFEIHKQVKANDIISRRYGDLMTSFSLMVSIPG